MFSQHGGRQQPPDIQHLGLLSESFSELFISPPPHIPEDQWWGPASPAAQTLPMPYPDHRDILPSDISLVIDGFQDLSVAQEMPQTDLSYLLYGFEEINISQPVPDDELSPLLNSFQHVSCQDSGSSSQHGDDGSGAASPVCSPEEAQSVIASLQALLQHQPELATDMLAQCPDAFPRIDSAYWRQLLSQSAN
ncbi:hypothetical protein FOMPIDRAFT_1018467 [Fomitopsis schrenkii]|uniref:Uncharacterized protein n=1 Tax=Fomitopsis schrenkii TaxID=2126942 RepID=S8FFG7_FOMSC|nr:hypothetical protein FOMPIDRAFT_1018467 [Fomitopsis schrenkii]